MTIQFRNGQLIRRALLAAPQGSWHYQRRLRIVEYKPVRLKTGRIVWGNPRVVDGGVNGGNLRDGGRYTLRPERSPYMRPLTAEESMAWYAYGQKHGGR